MNALAHGAIHGFLSVAAGAFGAHILEKILDPYALKIWNTAATYQMSHALALLLLGILELYWRKKFLWIHMAFGIGILLFSGSLYTLAFTGIRWLGAITPMGGTAFLFGWASLAWVAWRKREG